MVEQLESQILEQQFLEKCFAKMDVNKDGTITASEIAKTMKISKAEADELVREGDTDGDGELTFKGTSLKVKGQNLLFCAEDLFGSRNECKIQSGIPKYNCLLTE